MTTFRLDVLSWADERSALSGFLTRQRGLVRWKLAGASEEALVAASTPTGLTAHGVVRHLENVERSWFRDRWAGEDGLYFDWTDADPDGEFHVPAGVAMTDLLAAYEEECARCDAVVAAGELDAIGARTRYSLRWILHHMIEETARHLGHLDLLRESADGVVGEEPREAGPA